MYGRKICIDGYGPCVPFSFCISMCVHICMYLCVWETEREKNCKLFILPILTLFLTLFSPLVCIHSYHETVWLEELWPTRRFLMCINYDHEQFDSKRNNSESLICTIILAGSGIARKCKYLIKIRPTKLFWVIVFQTLIFPYASEHALGSSHNVIWSL
jgi:hypothetical protein